MNKKYLFKKRTLVMCFIFLFLGNICNGQQKKNAKVFPLQQLTGYTDSMLISKYVHDDTTDFQKAGIEIRHMSRVYDISETRACREKFRSNIQKKRKKYPKLRISNIEEASQWLKKVYCSHIDCNPYSCMIYYLEHYKHVDDGFLIKGKYIHHADYVLPYYCDQAIYWGMYLIGHDHNVLFIKDWFEDRCPDRYLPEITIEEYFPDFENAEKHTTDYSLLSDCGVDSLLLANIVYPKYAVEQMIQGRVIVSFIIDSKGTISAITRERGVDYSLDNEVIRCVKLIDEKLNLDLQREEKAPFKVYIQVRFILAKNPKYSSRHIRDW